jgi:hypothetical protein
MKSICSLAAAVWMLSLATSQAIVGYLNAPFQVGDNLFTNPLLGYDNHINSLFATAPEGTTVQLWNPLTRAYGVGAVFESGVWLDLQTLTPSTLSLLPGTGARLRTSAGFTNTFVGDVVNHDGTQMSFPDDTFTNPPPYPGPNGIFLRGDATPMAATNSDIFLHIWGRTPNPGEQFTRLDRLTQTYITSTYLGGGAWDVPATLHEGEAGFFNIGPVPEPGVAALSLAGTVLWTWSRRRLQRSKIT